MKANNPIVRRRGRCLTNPGRAATRPLAQNMIDAINALKIATITPTLNTWPAAGPATAAMKVLNGAGLFRIEDRSLAPAGVMLVTT